MEQFVQHLLSVIIHGYYTRRIHTFGKDGFDRGHEIEIPLRLVSSAAISRINERSGERKAARREEGEGREVSNAAHERVINGTFLDC